MKKHLLSLLCLLTFALPGLADTLTILPSNFTGTWGTNSYSEISFTDQVSGFEFKGHAVKQGNATVYNIGLKKSGGYIVMTANPNGYTIDSIEIVATTTSSKTTSMDVYKQSSQYVINGEETLSSLTGVKVGTYNMTVNEDKTFDLNVKDKFFAIRNSTAGGQIAIKKIVINYTKTTEKQPVSIFWNKDEDWTNEHSIVMLKDDYKKIIVGSDNENASSFIDKITVTSDNPDVVRVNSTMDGIVAVGLGTTTVSARIPESDTAYTSNVLTLNITVEDNTSGVVSSPVAKVNGNPLEEVAEIFVNDAIELICETGGNYLLFS